MKTRKLYDPQTGLDYRLNLETGTITGPDGMAITGELAERIGRRFASRARAAQARRGRDDALRGLGLVKVRGSMGGIYWE